MMKSISISIRGKKWYPLAKLLAEMVILLAVLYIIFGVISGAYRIEGVSMNERVKDGDLVLISRLNEQYHAGEVIVYMHEDKTLISEILASDGDVIEMDDDGYLYVNGIKISTGLMYDIDQGEQPSFAIPYRVPPNAYFVINENADAMEDSRTYGAIYKNEVKGKVIGLLRTRAI